MVFLIWIQDAAFSTWIRESDWAIFAILIVHTLGMAFLAGTGITVVIRVLGVAPGVPIMLLARLMPVMAIGLVTAILSGILLVLGYPAKALTNPLFYIKLTMLVAAWVVSRSLFRQFVAAADVVSAKTKRLAVGSLLLWLFVIVAGKFLAYTNTLLLVY
jgi:hypothetical protein